MATLHTTDSVKRELQLELCRRDFYAYCQTMHPDLYTPDRKFAKDVARKFQNFMEKSKKHFLVLNLPPRFLKSLTAGNFTEWMFGQSNDMRVMTGSYNEKLAMNFARKVRNTILTPPGEDGRILFPDIFPDTHIKKGEGAVDMWALEGSPVTNYLATSPTGTATGIGATTIIIDDIIKNASEAYNPTQLDGHWEWFNNTMLQRLEGNDWKVIIVMTRWATSDLAGRALQEFDCDHVTYKAYTERGGRRIFLCPSILNAASFDAKTKAMNRDIVMANYQQEPLDIVGRLYRDFTTYSPDSVRPGDDDVICAVTDTADKGTDFLCSLVYFVRDGIAYILDAVYSDEPMEITEQMVADMFDRNNVRVAYTEANNGGRLFARNVRRLCKNKRIVFDEEVSTTNKEARILDSSGWVQAYVWFPVGWSHFWNQMYREIMGYQRKGKNEHDDAVDALAMLFDQETRDQFVSQKGY